MTLVIFCQRTPRVLEHAGRIESQVSLCFRLEGLG
jgi:hypothetical protein